MFKLDWMSVWKFIVPYRDPSLLPRQWRTAIGTQKSYISDASKKAKRRLYESERKKLKSGALETWHTSSRKKVKIVSSVQTVVSHPLSISERCTLSRNIRLASMFCYSWMNSLISSFH